LTKFGGRTAPPRSPLAGDGECRIGAGEEPGNRT
jgi:hypothetical protein